MKITKERLKEIIKEETLKLVEEQAGQTPEEEMVLVRGYGQLRVEQIRGRLQEMIRDAAKDDSLNTFGAYINNGVMMALYETLVANNALLPPEEETIEITEGNFEEEYCRQNPEADGCPEYFERLDAEDEAIAAGLNPDDYSTTEQLIAAIHKAMSLR